MKNTKSLHTTNLELYRDLTLFDKKIRENLMTYNYRQGYRYKVAIVTFVLFTPLIYNMINGINFIFFATKDASVLNTEILTVIPKGYSINNINDDVDDFMLLAWDMNVRTPRFFSKWNVDTIKDNKKQDYDLTFDDMVTASAANI